MGRQSSIKRQYRALQPFLSGEPQIDQAVVMFATQGTTHRHRRNLLRRIPQKRFLSRIATAIRIEYHTGRHATVKTQGMTKAGVEDQLAKIARRSTVKRVWAEYL